jgi:Ras-related protein Rab-23
MDLGDVDAALKVLVLGAEGVGKSALTSVFCRGDFPIQHRKTIGTEFKEKDLTLEDDDGVAETTNLMLWEIGGEQTLAPMHARHLRDANAVVLVFSTTDRASFERLREIYAKVREECERQCLVVLVQNKVDLLDDATMTTDEVEQLARDLRVRLYRVSCKDPDIVEQVFVYIAAKLEGSAGQALADIGTVVAPAETGADDGAKVRGQAQCDGEESGAEEGEDDGHEKEAENEGPGREEGLPVLAASFVQAGEPPVPPPRPARQHVPTTSGDGTKLPTGDTAQPASMVAQSVPQQPHTRAPRADMLQAEPQARQPSTVVVPTPEAPRQERTPSKQRTQPRARPSFCACM